MYCGVPITAALTPLAPAFPFIPCTLKPDPVPAKPLPGFESLPGSTQQLTFHRELGTHLPNAVRSKFTRASTSVTIYIQATELVEGIRL